MPIGARSLVPFASNTADLFDERDPEGARERDHRELDGRPGPGTSASNLLPDSYAKSFVRFGRRGPTRLETAIGPAANATATTPRNRAGRNSSIDVGIPRVEMERPTQRKALIRQTAAARISPRHRRGSALARCGSAPLERTRYSQPLQCRRPAAPPRRLRRSTRSAPLPRASG